MNFPHPLRRVIVLAALAGLAMLNPRPLPAAAAPPQSTVVDRESAELLQAWLAGRPVPPTSTDPALDPLADWRAYLRALEIRDAAAREKALREVYGETRSPMLRGVILRAITENPEFQGRQALFIRRYGFYANWFNRLVFSASRLVQGQVQVLGQLAVDSVYDLVGPGETGPDTRRAYDLLRRAEAAGGPRSPEDRDRLAKLEREVVRALAQSDLDQAQWALTQGDPEGAAFYANQAALLRPDWPKAETVRLKAEAEGARLRRDQIASSQVGYPDRTPQVEPASPGLLRTILADRPIQTEALPEREALVGAALHSLPSPQYGRAALMRRWRELLGEDPAPDGYPHRWLEALIDSPQANVDQRLAEARSRYRSSTWKYVFIGPERPREQAYKAASWMAQAWSAMSNVGVFYVFEVLGRGGRAIWATPVPAEEYLDAQAAWLRQAPDPKGKEARKIAEKLYTSYMEAYRYDDARRMLEGAGLLTPARERKIAKAEATWLLDTAQQLPAGPERQALVARIAKLDPGSTAATKAARIAELEAKHAETRKLRLDWETLARWTHLAPPCGLPGEALWFDTTANGPKAAREGLTLERRAHETTLTVRYPVDYATEQRIHQVTMPFKSLPPVVQQWFELSATQGSDAAASIKKLDRLPIPFSLEGDAGLSGVDFYPRLLPIQTKPGEVELYR